MARQRAEQLLIAHGGGSRPGQYHDIEAGRVFPFCRPMPETFPNHPLDAVATHCRAIDFLRNSHAEAQPAHLVWPGKDAKEAIVRGLGRFDSSAAEAVIEARVEKAVVGTVKALLDNDPAFNQSFVDKPTLAWLQKLVTAARLKELVTDDEYPEEKNREGELEVKEMNI